MTGRKYYKLDEQLAGRRLCSESGKATGFWEMPKRRKRCLACGRLTTFRDDGQGIVVGRHYVYPTPIDKRVPHH